MVLRTDWRLLGTSDWVQGELSDYPGNRQALMADEEKERLRKPETQYRPLAVIHSSSPPRFDFAWIFSEYDAARWPS